jgi:DNA-binding NarL/FixJ family response regulator
VVLDHSMPGVGGRDTVPALWKLRPDIPVLISSGYGEAETMRLLAGLDVTGFIQKPYTHSHMAARVGQALGMGPGAQPGEKIH